MTNAQLPLEIDAHGLGEAHAQNRSVAFIDVRTPMEVMQARAGESVNIPLNNLPQAVHQLPKDVDHLVIICAHGNRSLMATHWLRQNGFETAQSLRGGMAMWRQYQETAA